MRILFLNKLDKTKVELKYKNHKATVENRKKEEKERKEKASNSGDVE